MFTLFTLTEIRLAKFPPYSKVHSIMGGSTPLHDKSTPPQTARGERMGDEGQGGGAPKAQTLKRHGQSP